jgi:ABC-type transport system substrate-binding protein
MSGYRELRPCPFGAPESGGDVATARAIVEREGAAGAPVQVWGHTLEPNRQATEAFADQLAAIGFKPRLKLVSPSLYFELVGGAKPVFQAGIGAWFQEYPHPTSFFDAVRGDLIRASGNYNYSRTDIPSLTAAIKRLRGEPELTWGTRSRWAALDKRVVNDAGVIPFGHSRSSVFMSERMDFARCSPRHLVYITDFSRFCVR